MGTGISAILAIDALALAAVLASAPAAFVWLDGSKPSPIAVGPTSPHAASPTPTAPAGSGAATPQPSQAAPTVTAVPTPRILYGDGTWDGLPPMPLALWGSADVVLDNGQVLVIGGASGPSSTSAVAAVEVFDPQSQRWAAAAPMLQARAYPAVALLPDGSVLVAGGSRNGVPLDSTERYFPDTGTWVSAGALSAPRTQASATTLLDGRVLILGGGSEASPGYRSTNAAELFDPATGKWTPTTPMSTARAFHTATLLPNGEVLVAGGASIYHGARGKVVATAEIYDPESATWHNAPNMSVARYHHTAAPLPDGRVLVAGGWALTTNSDKSLATAEIYDPAKNAWTRTGSMATGRARAVVTPLPDGRVLVATGVDPAYRAMATAEIWSASTGRWQLTGKLGTAVMWPAFALLLDGRVLIAGGALDAVAAHETSVAALYTPTSP
jgi:N-acetylneuraminic acid mutarotase